MPCESGYLEPSWGEVESRRICKHICYVFKKINKKIPNEVVLGADNYYGNQLQLSEFRNLLINTIKNLSDDLFENIIYNAKSKESRDLANWWERELKEIEDEEKNKKRIRDRERLIKNILSKLRKEETDIINKYIDWKKIREGK